MKVLIVVDMQNDFIDGSLGTIEAVNIVDKVVKKIKNFNGEIIFTRDTHGKDYLKTQEGKFLPVEHCIKGTKGWEINEKIEVLRKTQPIDKLTFGSQELVKRLKNIDGLEEIELVGLCTDICIISNALLLKAYFLETPISVDANCCAGVTPESHNRALDAMNVCQIKIINRI